MDIIVCVKRVPETVEADLAVDRTGRGLKAEDLVYDLNDWDVYAVEEAVRLKESLGGQVTVLSLGPDEARDVLRRCLAMGADEAVLLTGEAFEDSDPAAVARALAAALEGRKYDLVLTGVQAADDNAGQVGVALAGYLGRPHAAIVTALEVRGDKIEVRRELEGSLEEALELDLPAVLTIQSGINEPRYVSIMGIRKVRKKEIRTPAPADLGLRPDQLGPAGSPTTLVSLSVPPPGDKANMLGGSLEDMAGQVLEALKSEGGWSGE